MSSLHPGDLVDNRYRIGARIARGGMSTVYTAVDTRLDREVAVKVMDPSLAKERTFRTRFEREARAVAKLNHPALVNVFDQGVDGELVFLVMELVVGGSLRELLKERGPMPPHAALAVMKPVLTALSVAHATGMVHRDIKPDNVLISDTHQVKLADFGLVRAISTGVNSTAATSADGTVIGTVGYLSPEQVQGKSLDQRSDVYSAGVLLFELLTGHTPFHEDTPIATAMARLHRNVPLASGEINGVPEVIDELITVATSREPDQRYADGAAFLEAVDEAARRLSLPSFLVPSPENSAVRRALAGADFGERLSWDDESMSTRAVNLESQQVTKDSPVFDRPEMTAHTQLQPEQALRPHHDRPQQDAHSPDAAYPMNPAWNVPPGQQPYPSASMHHSPAGSVVASNGLHQQTPTISNRSTGRTVVWVLIILILVALIATGSWWLTSGRYGEVPNVLGMDQATAQATVESAGFTSTLEQRYSDDDARDAVIGTDPSFGVRTPRGSQVSVLVSLGKPTVPQPGTDDNFSSYTSRLSERTLTGVLGDEVFSEDVAKGDVATTTPPVGREVPTHSTVKVHLSKGPRPVTIPDVEGQSESRAKRTLASANLNVNSIIKEFSDRVEEGYAIGTQPGEGKEVAGGSDVTLVMSNAIKVPDVTGMNEDDARKTLREAGLSPITSDPVSDRNVDNGEVAEQSPASGELINPADNTEVEIRLSNAVRIPLVLGSKADSAKTRLEQRGLSVEIDGPADGLVYSQSPSSRTWATEGDTVRLRSF
ncbi:Stk1 family PASTA domain-containing Ser/Thr kinase [Corynebacterium sp. 4HC-13]|uniref:Stk1 family PASTA domain-containing Ser/Thr kinase n=1 Tax=Corynebacterium anserum TaxID=2684406 RepID=UPI00163A8965|nr:Stk1 family PASTA domain-containing Ser/Thr kinase [Corynebacterium anserum]MBC2680930.1 Stk1 family PASTA domain-containing Ser/Thr kinase [Corynebacterium anserum]